MSNTYIHPFHGQHQYFSFYPTYLPSYYSNYYPRHYNRYYEPVSHVTAKVGAMQVQDTMVDVLQHCKSCKTCSDHLFIYASS